MGVTDAVRRQAVLPWTYLPAPPEFELVQLDGATIAISPWPIAQIVRIDGSGPADVAATVEAARAVAGERGKSIVAWWIAREHDAFAADLEVCGLVNEDTPGFEAIENAMALTEPPSGESDPAIDVRVRESWEDFLAANHVAEVAFGLPSTPEEVLQQQFEQSRRPDNPGRAFLASIDGHAVGTGFAVPGEAGVNLFGGAVVEDARGRGVYRALVQARWEWAVQLGTPALTVQAGRMSMPVLEKLGFAFLEPVRVFVDSL